MRRILDLWSDRIRRHWTLAVFALALAAGVGWSDVFLDGQQRACDAATAEARLCQRLSQQIAASRGIGADYGKILLPAEGTSANGGDTSQQISQSAHAAGMASENVERIAHDAGQRIGNSPYIRQRTEISLRAVSMEQVVEFLKNLQAGASPLVSQTLRLAPAGDQADPQHSDERWDAAVSATNFKLKREAK